MSISLSVLNLATLLPPLSSHELLRTDLNPIPIVLLVGALALYLWGVVRHNRLHPRHPWPALRTTAFIVGIVVTAVAVLSFIGVYDATLFWDHMVQHLMLVMIAGALFAAASPLALAWRASTGTTHRWLTSALRSRPADLLGHPIVAYLLYAVLVPLTHVTFFFNYAIEYPAVDALEHLLFLAVGYDFWRQILGADPNRYRPHPAVRALYLFLAIPVDTFVGLSLDSETHEIFPAFTAMHRTWGVSLVQDLHIGGVIMWVGGDSLMMLALVPVIAQWVRLEERRGRRFDRQLDEFFPAPDPHARQPTAGIALGRYTPRGQSRDG